LHGEAERKIVQPLDQAGYRGVQFIDIEFVYTPPLSILIVGIDNQWPEFGECLQGVILSSLSKDRVAGSICRRPENL